MRKACSEVGFMYVKNVEGLNQDLIDRCLGILILSFTHIYLSICLYLLIVHLFITHLAQTERFFSFSSEKKNRIHTSDNNPKGYYKV